jgi:hypothetical protein
MKRSRILSWAALALSAVALACASSYPPSGPHGQPDYRYSHPYYPPDNRSYGYSNERFAALAHELDDRAARAHEIAETRAASLGPREQEFFARIHHFSDQARSFHERYESGQINSRGQLREEISHLLDDARNTDQSIRRANVFPEVWDEWRGVLGVLQRMLDVVGA